MSEPYVGEIRVFAFNYAPRGWAACNGQLLPLRQNTTLFAVLGTTYGGDGRNNFALPDLRGRAAMHPGQGAGLSPRTLGESAGTATVELDETHLPTHVHGMIASDERGDGTSPVQGYFATGTDMYHPDGNTNLAPITLGTAGGEAAHNNMMPYLSVNFCMALVGVFPPRS